ncbi:MAG: biopolymer transporter ExbD [Pirellulales bacterium]|nr:biopolymer transporter ExbD [Pirellulales bacterium]
MRTPQLHRDSQRDFDVNMTPMIDVVFLLLVFFVCTTDFRAIESLLPTPLKASGATGEAVDPPQDPPELEELEPIVIKLSLADGQPRWQLNARVCREPAELHDTLAKLAALERRLPVILDIDGDVPLGVAIDLYDRCRLAGFERLRFAAPAPADE